VLGSILAVYSSLALLVGWAAVRSNLGYGPVGNVVFALTTLALGALILSSAGWGLATLIRRLPPRSSAALLAAALAGVFVIGLLLPHPLARLAVLAMVLLVGWVGGAATLFVQRGLATGASKRLRWASGGHLGIALLTTVFAFAWTIGGARAVPGAFAGYDPALGSLNGGADPAAWGAFEVERFSYGSGSDRRRPSYAGAVEVRSPTLDLRPLLSGFREWEADAHRAYWGFGLHEAPMNARVWLPVSAEGPAPLVLVVPGINPGMDASEEGFSYLAERLASRGFAVVAIDVNYLGGPRISQWAQEMPVRAWLALEHLAFLRAWQGADPEGVVGRIDLSRIALLGHSRGGEAVAIAAGLNTLGRYPADATIPVSFGFGVRAVVALAPTDGYRWAQGRGTDLDDVSYLAIHGSQDSDVMAFFGQAQYQRVRIPHGSPALKAAVYIPGANHSHFNADRAPDDQPGFLGAFLDQARVLPGEVQRAITLSLVSAFLETALMGVDVHRPFLRDPGGGGSWLTSLGVSSRYEDGRTRIVADFEEDDDPASTTLEGGTLLGRRLAIWREEAVRLRDPSRTRLGNTVVHLGWRGSPGTRNASEFPAYEVRLPLAFSEEAALSSSGALTFSMGQSVAGVPEIPGIVVEVVSSEGDTARVPLMNYGIIPAPNQSRIWRIPFADRWLYPEAETVLQSFEIPLSDFEAVRPGLNLRAIEQIRFVFEPSSWGAVLLDDIGFRSRTTEILP
jgi:predicted dienelactone hydrolase